MQGINRDKPWSISSLPVFGALSAGHFEERERYAVWREHGLDSWLLFLTLSGRGRIGCASSVLLTGPDELVLIAPDTPQDYGLPGVHGHWEFLYTHFRPKPSWLELLNWPEEGPGVMRLLLPADESARMVRARFHDVVRYVRGPYRQATSLAMNALEAVLLGCDCFNPGADTCPIDSRIRRALDYIHQHLGDPFWVENLAARSELSSSRFAHLFKREVGSTPGQYVEKHRLERAKELLLFTSRQVMDIACEVGYTNACYFSLRFRNATGLTPSEFRQQQG